MFDTTIAIIGNVLTAPEWRRTTNTNSLVANFKVASTARRLDRDTGRWVDGNSLRVRVNCWRKLAEGVASSVMVGDPVVVVGRLYTRDWTDADGNPRTQYEMEAVAVGHDLARGRGRFVRNRPTLATSAVEDAQAETQVRGEATEPVPAEQVPVRRGENLFDDGEPEFVEAPTGRLRPGAGYLGDELAPFDPGDAAGFDAGALLGASFVDDGPDQDPLDAAAPQPSAGSRDAAGRADADLDGGPAASGSPAPLGAGPAEPRPRRPRRDRVSAPA